jgi:hypothetical protein
MKQARHLMASQQRIIGAGTLPEERSVPNKAHGWPTRSSRAIPLVQARHVARLPACRSKIGVG